LIPGYRCSVNEIFGLLGRYYAVLVVTGVLGQPICPLKMGQLGSPETSVTIKKRPITSQKKEVLIYSVAEA
jgi:hypothetical protein